MNDAWLLTKVFFKKTFGVNKKKNKQVNPILEVASVGLIFAIILGLFSYFYPTLIGKDKPIYNIIVLSAIFVSLILIIISFFQMHTTLFHSKDFGFLASLPISSHSIVLGKLLSLFFFDLIISLVAMIPVVVIYMLFGGTVIGLFISILVAIFIPCVPLLVVTLIGIIVGVLTAKSKYSNAISIVLYIVFFLGYSVGLTLAFASGDGVDKLIMVFPYYNWIYDAFAGNYLSLIWFLLLNVGGFFLVYVIVSLLYYPLNQIHQKTNAKAYTMSGEATSTPHLKRILFKKEILLVVRNTNLLCSSYLIPLIFGVLALVSFGLIGKGFNGPSEDGLKSLNNNLRIVEVIVGAIFGSVCSTTYASFSLEGHNYALLHSYPIDKKDIIRAKIKASIIPSGILFILMGAIFATVCGFTQGFEHVTYSMWLGIIIVPLLSLILTSLIGTLCGMRWIKLEFVDSADVLKKSKALGYTLLFSILINLLFSGGYVILLTLLSPDRNPNHDILALGIVTAAYIIVISIFACVLKAKGEELFHRGIE